MVYSRQVRKNWTCTFLPWPEVYHISNHSINNNVLQVLLCMVMLLDFRSNEIHFVFQLWQLDYRTWLWPGARTVLVTTWTLGGTWSYLPFKAFTFDIILHVFSCNVLFLVFLHLKMIMSRFINDTRLKIKTVSTLLEYIKYCVSFKILPFLAVNICYYGPVRAWTSNQPIISQAL